MIGWPRDRYLKLAPIQCQQSKPDLRKILQTKPKLYIFFISLEVKIQCDSHYTLCLGDTEREQR